MGVYAGCRCGACTSTRGMQVAVCRWGMCLRLVCSFDMQPDHCALDVDAACARKKSLYATVLSVLSAFCGGFVAFGVDFGLYAAIQGRSVCGIRVFGVGVNARLYVAPLYEHHAWLPLLYASSRWVEYCSLKCFL